MKIRRHLLDRRHANGRRQTVVENFTKIYERDDGLSRKTSCLGKCVHAGVSPPRALQEYLFAGYPSNDFGQNSLHRWQARLNLPSMELRAIVRDRQFEIAAHAFRSMHAVIGDRELRLKL
jgi:hypothetical protein